MVVTSPAPYGDRAKVDEPHLFILAFQNMPPGQHFLRVEVDQFGANITPLGGHAFSERFMRFSKELYYAAKLRKGVYQMGPPTLYLHFFVINGAEEVVVAGYFPVVLSCWKCPELYEPGKKEKI
jgi:hypothetical protein